MRSFEDHESAVRALSSQSPHAVIVKPPPGDAANAVRDVIKVLRQKIPVSVPVLWVLRDGWETCLNTLRAGADGCIQEPVPMASLASRLRRLIATEDRPPHRLLLVIADPKVRTARTTALRDSGFVVEGVDDPMQTLPVALRFAPEVVLIDSSLPAMDGLELAHLLRQEDALQTVPIVLLCEGPDGIKNRHRLRQFELDYLVHPFSESDLLERLCLRGSQYRSMTSQGTGRIRNPSAFLERSRFGEMLENAGSGAGTQGFRALLFLEIDGYGHLIRSHDLGILEALSARIESALRLHLQPEDVAARYDDAAYAALIYRDEPEQLEALEHSLRQALTKVSREDSQPSDVGFRLGVTPVGSDGDVRAALCEAAIRSRSTAKADPVAENGIMGEPEPEPEPESMAMRTPPLDDAGRRHWGGRIRDAILGNKLFLMFQPIFPVSGNDAIERYEVLLRIREDNGDVSLPSETLAMAEQLGMSGLLDRWVIDTALEILSTHRQTSPSTIFFLKVTGDTLRDDRFLEWLEETLRRRALDPGSVVMQVREADAVAQRQRIQEMIRRLHEQGVAVGLEHFGLRAASVELLQSLNVDFVKLDRALVQGLADGPSAASTILSLLYQTRARGVTIIASYVESADSLAHLWNERVDLVQGNFLHGPDLNLAYEPVL
ncbi:EAL domain-containing protein [Thioalkalivibrio sp.]|uniref:EAL domain-containing protein n=1 Tax=Thioalkalivibrio sp. TaxID=2093813 RepID=UPI003975A8E0